MAATMACVSTSCCSITSSRDSYGRQGQQQQQGGQGAAPASPPFRSGFSGEKLAASLKAQAWLPVAPLKQRKDSKGPLSVSSVLMEPRPLEDTIVSIVLIRWFLHTFELVRPPTWDYAELLLKIELCFFLYIFFINYHLCRPLECCPSACSAPNRSLIVDHFCLWRGCIFAQRPCSSPVPICQC